MLSFLVTTLGRSGLGFILFKNNSSVEFILVYWWWVWYWVQISLALSIVDYVMPIFFSFMSTFYERILKHRLSASSKLLPVSIINLAGYSPAGINNVPRGKIASFYEITMDGVYKSHDWA